MESEIILRAFLGNIGVYLPFNGDFIYTIDDNMLLCTNFANSIFLFIFCFPLMWHLYTDEQNIRTLLLLEQFLLHPSLYFLDYSENLTLMPLFSFAKSCVSTFRRGRTHKQRKPVFIPPPSLLRVIRLAPDASVPSFARFSLALNEIHRLGSLLYINREDRIEMARPRAIALAMASHPRLGENSLLAELEDGTLREIIHLSLETLDLRE